MKTLKKGITFIIPYRQGEELTDTLLAVNRAMHRIGGDYEIVTASGNHPTKQRNLCIEQASFDFCYFIDNDSIVDADSITKFREERAARPEIKIVGGPTLPIAGGIVSSISDNIFSSTIAIGQISSRYTQKGKSRPTDDKELILCNLFIETRFFARIGLFNEKLYPNEENEFIHRALAAKTAVRHNPDITIERLHRITVAAFIKQFSTYGRGRGEQTKIAPRSFPLMLTLPIGFTLYLPLSVLFLILRHCASAVLPEPILSDSFYRAALLPAAAYGCLLFVFFCRSALRPFTAAVKKISDPEKWRKTMRRPAVIFLSPLFLLLSHLSYTIGFFHGFFSRKFRTENRKTVYSLMRIDKEGNKTELLPQSGSLPE